MRKSSPVLSAWAWRRSQWRTSRRSRRRRGGEEVVDLHELNDALLWLGERQGKITFSVSVDDRVDNLEPECPTVQVIAVSVTEEEALAGAEFTECSGVAAISKG